jgi:UDP-N-acetylmuramate dehydrogenase
MNEKLVEELETAAHVRLNEPMSRHTTFGVGGPANIYVPVKTEVQLRHVHSTARRYGEPVTWFGSGSNMLVGDGGIRGVVIENQFSEVMGPEKNGNGFRVRIGSGMSFASLARRMANSGFGGIEWACGIPGSLGGAVVTNAGAYGHSLKDVMIGARLVNERGEVIEVKSDDLDLTYRNSSFTKGKLKDAMVLSVDLRVQQGDVKILKDRVRQLDEQRKGAQPPGQNCGSVFKNPVRRSAWEYVDDVGLRGHRIGNAQITPQHSNFIQNLGGATAKDVIALIKLAQDKVREQFDVELETEVQFVGEFD